MFFLYVIDWISNQCELGIPLVVVSPLLVAMTPLYSVGKPPLVVTSSQEDPRRLFLGMAHIGAGGYHLFGEGLNAHALCPLAEGRTP